MRLLKIFGQLFLCTAVMLMSSQTVLFAQNKVAPNIKSISKGPADFPELIFTAIPGAPRLGIPQLIMGSTGPVNGEGNGWAAPAVWDWNKDGKKDLLIGEFGSGSESLVGSVGNFIRIYLNEGSDIQPSFTDDFKYAKGDENIGNGTPLSIYTWCCLPFTPRIVDLDSDGHSDIVTGQYNPGFVIWFRGSEKGFLPGEKLNQEGDPTRYSTNHKLPVTDITGYAYWNYSSVAFGDFDGDGDQDMIVGGQALRISENTGTKYSPRFGKRTLLLDIHGKPLRISKIKNALKIDSVDVYDESVVGSHTSVPYVDDWDNDGIPDLLVTAGYTMPGRAVVTYFRGVKTSEGLRFETGVPLFTTKNAEKEFPGSVPNICVADWNNDGIKDLLIGMKVATFKREFDPTLSWSWDGQTSTHKLDPGNYSSRFLKSIKREMDYAQAYQDSTGLSTEELRKLNRSNSADIYKHYFVKEEYRYLSHKGYVYVMLGKKQ